MDFAMLPPEVNSARMYSGPGAEAMLAAAVAWDTLAGELHAAGAFYETAISELTTQWAGPSATAMAAAATPYATWMHTTAVQAQQTAAQAKAAAAAYQTAFAMTVPPAVVATNRSRLTALLATNLAGQNTAAIAAAEADYAEMWAQDAAAMYDYAGNAATASILKPFAPSPQTTNPAGSANSSAAVGQAAAAAGSHAQTAIAQLTTVPNSLQSLASPAAAGSVLSTAPLGAAAPSMAADPALTLAYLGLASSLFGTFIVDGAGTFGVDVAGSFGIDLIGVGEIENDLLPLEVLTGWTEPVTASVGEAAEVGALSVPQEWALAAPAAAVQPAGTTLTAAAAAAAAPAVSGVPFAEMAIAGLAGRAIAAAGRGGRAGAGAARVAGTPQPAQAPEQSQPDGPITGLAAELRELADLRDAGILTEEEFTEQKRRLLDSKGP